MSSHITVNGGGALKTNQLVKHTKPFPWLWTPGSLSLGLTKLINQNKDWPVSLYSPVCVCVWEMYYACQLTRPHWIICSCLFLVQQSCSKHKHFKYPLLVSFFAGFLRFTLFLSSHFLPFAILILFFGFILFFSFILFFVWYLSLSHSVCPVCIYWFFFVCLLFKTFSPFEPRFLHVYGK